MSGPLEPPETKYRYFQEGNDESGADLDAYMILAAAGKSPPSKG